MSAFVFIILALGYLNASEAKEQLSLTDFLLDFLLSLWVPANYAPSNTVQNVPDPALREQMISVEKSKNALDNYIQHLLRYATESSNVAIDNLQADLNGDLIPDSTQLSNTDSPFACKTLNYGCDYAAPDSNQLYPNPEVFPTQAVPYPGLAVNQGMLPDQGMSPAQGMLPVLTVYPNPTPLPNLGIIPTQGQLYEQNIHSDYFHQNKRMSMHSHQPHHHPHHHQHPNHHHLYHQVEFENNLPLPNDEDTASFPDWAPDSISDGIASLIPDSLGQSSNIFSSLMSPNEDDSECDPDVAAALYNPTYCTPAEAQPYFYRGVKRTIADPNKDKKQILMSELEGNSFPGWLQKPVTPLAKKIMYLATDKGPRGITGPRMYGTVLVQKPEVLESFIRNPSQVLLRNINASGDKEKRENDVADDPAKDLETRIFEEWYLPHFLDDILRGRYSQKLEPTPTAADVELGPQYYDNQLNDYTDSFVANRILDKKLNPSGTILKGLQHYQGHKEDVTPTIEINRELLRKRALLPNEK